MSESKQRHEAQRWLTTAREDLAAAQALRQARHFPQSCFLCQQAAEKAVKALWLAQDADPWGHSVQKLLTDYPARDQLRDTDALRRAAIELDRLYIPTRYPNGIPDLTPGQTYTDEDAGRALDHAQRLLAEASRLLLPN
jgi:HEPN domain-containing protein